MNDIRWQDPFAEDEAARERQRRRAEREARRRERAVRRSQSRGALADRVKELIQRDAAPARLRTPEPPSPPGAWPPAALQGDRRPPQPPRPPHGPKDVYWRRRALALGALLVAIGIVVAIGAVIHHFASGGTSGGTSEVATPAGPARKVTIPEGYDRHQVAEIAKKAGIRGDYVKASKSLKGFDPNRYGAQNPSSLEGFLFPATYDLPRHPAVDDLIVRQLAAFRQYVSRVDMSYARSKNLTTYDVLTIASMIEREVQVAKERRLVAAVIYNRLHAGMPLQIDATIRYATGNFTEPLTVSQLQVDSPYNTYTNSGLPPGPIDNPGLASIKAAAKPAQVPYLYYVVKPGTCPAQHTFATTEPQFERAKAAYDRARAAAGGQSPTC